MKIEDKCIYKTKIIENDLDTLWWKWTTREGLLSFFGKDNKIDFKVGGAYEIYFLMNNPVGERGGEGNKVLSFTPKRMLSFSWNAPPEYPTVRHDEHKTWVVVEFHPVASNKTLVNLTHSGWLEGEDWDKVYAYFDKAWEVVLHWLDETG